MEANFISHRTKCVVAVFCLSSAHDNVKTPPSVTIIKSFGAVFAKTKTGNTFFLF